MSDKCELIKISQDDFEFWKKGINPDIREEDFQSIVQKFYDDEKAGSTFSFWFSHLGNVVGFLQLFAVMKHPFQSGYIEIFIFEEERKKGYGKHAIRLLEEFAFKEQKLNKIVAPILPENSASIALFKSLSYEKVHSDPYAFFFNGKPVPHEIFVKIN